MAQKPLLLLFLGSPGSGKSYFARNFAKKTNAVRLNADSMRMALYGSREEIARQPDVGIVNKLTFGALDYAVAQVLKAGHTVAYDSHHSQRTFRANLELLAKEHDAIPIVIWVKTPYDIALKRGQEREATPDQQRLSEEKMRELIERHMSNFDEPIASEFVVNIDGTIPFEEQYESFKQQLKTLTDLQ